jgi:hypothetical protein
MSPKTPSGKSTPSPDLDAFLQTCRLHTCAKPSQAVVDGTSAFFAALEGNDQLLNEAVGYLPTLPPWGVSWLALTMGSAVELGYSAQLAGPSLLSFFRTWLERFPKADEDGNFNPLSSEQEVIRDAFPQFCQSVVAYLAHMPEVREAWGTDATLMDRISDLETLSYGASWVHEALSRSSDTLLVLAPNSEQGFLFKYSNVANCFHLFSLLQLAIGKKVPGGKNPSEKIRKIVDGKHNEHESDEAWWHYGDPRSPVSAIGDSIWGEMTTRDLPKVEGMKIILLWPPILGGRSWGTSFFGLDLAAMPPSAVIERTCELSEVREWLRKLGIGQE